MEKIIERTELKPIVFKDVTLTSLEKDEDTDVAYAEMVFDGTEVCLAHEYLATTDRTGIKFLDDKVLDTNGYYACGILKEGKEYKGVFYNDNLIDVFNKF